MTMENPHIASTEVRLSALLDGEVGHDEREELEALIKNDPQVRELYETLKRGTETGNRAFDDLMQDPVPLALVRNIKNAEPPRKPMNAGATQRPAFNLAPTGPQALAASLLLFALGGGLGYLIGAQPVPTATPPLQIAEVGAGNWLNDIAAHHRVYSRQQRHLVEVPASEEQHIVEWLSASVGVNFQVPNLTRNKLEFQGARLLVAAGKPVAQLLYKDESGDIIAICLMKNGMDGDDTDFIETIRDDIGMVSWQRGSTAYVVVGPSSEPTLGAIAEQVAIYI